MIDFHCHLDLYHSPRQVLAEVVRRQVYVLAVTTTPLAWEGTNRLIGDAPRVRIAAGLHPELVATRYMEVDRLCGLVPRTRYVGEIGLDGSSPHRHSLRKQQSVMQAVLKACERAGGRVISIHSRRAATLVLDELEAHPDCGVPVLHWFSGTNAELRRAIDRGCWFSVNPSMVASKTGRRLLVNIPPERVLTETDGPFVHHNGGPAMPWHVADVETALGHLWEIPATVVSERLRANFACLVRHAKQLPTVG